MEKMERNNHQPPLPSKKRKKHKDKQLTLTAHSNSHLGLTISAIQQEEFPQAELARTAQARYLPFALPKDSPGWSALAIKSANQLEAWAKDIREYAGLPTNLTENEATTLTLASNNGAATHTQSAQPTPSLCDHESSCLEEEEEEEEDQEELGASHVQTMLKKMGVT